MNGQRRKRIMDVSKQFDALESDMRNLAVKFSDLLSLVEDIKDEECDAYDNLPEGLQNGEKGQAMQSAIDNLDSIVSQIEEIVDTLENVGDDVVQQFYDAI